MFLNSKESKIHYSTKRCSQLEEGFEWLAFTFKNQDLKDMNKKDLNKLFEHSESCLIDAYSRMKMSEQNWTKHTAQEIDFIEKYIPSKSSKILDIGCVQAGHWENSLKSTDLKAKEILLVVQKNKLY